MSVRTVQKTVMTESNGHGSDRSLVAVAGLSALGIAYVVAGLGLFYGLAIDSMQVFTAGLIAVLLLLAISMGIIIWNEPLVSRENAVISGCVFTAMAFFLGLSTFTTFPFTVLVGTLIFVGVIVPGFVLQYGPLIGN